tara:strand:+ start:18860 stop:19354 length:495 start_codon:yes stop_codon:yes gene_type:complete
MENFIDYIIPAIIFGVYIFSNLFGGTEKPPEEEEPQSLEDFLKGFSEQEPESQPKPTPTVAPWTAAKKKTVPAPPPTPKVLAPQKDLGPWTRSHNKQTHKERTHLNISEKSTKEAPQTITYPSIAKRYLADQDSVRNAFLLHEIIGPPVAFRKQAKGHPFSRPS